MNRVLSRAYQCKSAAQSVSSKCQSEKREEPLKRTQAESPEYGQVPRHRGCQAARKEPRGRGKSKKVGSPHSVNYANPDAPHHSLGHSHSALSQCQMQPQHPYHYGYVKEEEPYNTSQGHGLGVPSLDPLCSNETVFGGYLSVKA